MVVGKKRNGWLTAWLVLMIVASAVVVVAYLTMSETIFRSLPKLPGWALPALIVLAVFNIVCVIALLRWKKWGFWGVCASSIVAFIVNLSSGAGIGAILGLLGPAILYGVLHVGKENKGWPQLV